MIRRSPSLIGLGLLIIGLLGIMGVIPGLNGSFLGSIGLSASGTSVVAGYPSGTTSSPGNVQAGVANTFTGYVTQNAAWTTGAGCIAGATSYSASQNCVFISVAFSNMSSYAYWNYYTNPVPSGPCGGSGQPVCPVVTFSFGGMWSKMYPLPNYYSASTICPSTGQGYVGQTICTSNEGNATSTLGGTPCIYSNCVFFSFTVNLIPAWLNGQYGVFQISGYDATGQVFRQVYFFKVSTAPESSGSGSIPAPPITTPFNNPPLTCSSTTSPQCNVAPPQSPSPSSGFTMGWVMIIAGALLVAVPMFRKTR